MKKFKKIGKYLLGAGAGVILAGAVVGGVVSCSNGNTTNTNSNGVDSKNTRPTPNTTSDYQLTPQAQQGITYNESLQPKTSTMITTDIAYASTQALQQQQGLDVYVGGILASVITSNTKSVNLTLSLSDIGQLIDGVQFSKMGSLIAFEPSNSQNVINLTPYELGLLQAGVNNSGAVQFNLTGDKNPVDISFPISNKQVQFTNAKGTFKVNGVDINLNIDLKPFETNLTSQVIDLSTLDATKDPVELKEMKNYLAKGDYSKPFILSIPAPTFPSGVTNKYIGDGTFNVAFLNVPAVSIPLTFTDNKGEAPTIYAYYENMSIFQIEPYQYTFNTTGLPTNE